MEAFQRKYPHLTGLFGLGVLAFALSLTVTSSKFGWQVSYPMQFCAIMLIDWSTYLRGYRKP